jgi:hypothetical protein
MSTIEFLGFKIHNCLELHDELRLELVNCVDREEEKEIENQLERVLIELEFLEEYRDEVEEVSEFEDDHIFENEDIMEEEEITFDIEKMMDFSNPRMMNDKFYRELVMDYLIENELFEECQKIQEFELEINK